MKRALAAPVLLAVLVFLALSTSGCSNPAAGTWVWTENTISGKYGTTFMVSVLKIDASGKYTETEMFTDDLKDLSQPEQITIDAGTCTAAGDKLTFEGDMLEPRHGILEGDSIRIEDPRGDTDYVKQ